MNQQLKNELQRHDSWNRRFLCAIFATFGLPESYLDVGCGTGAMVDLAYKMGVDAWGIDIIHNANPRIIHRDLRDGFISAYDYDLVTCVEVMEHIEPQFENATLQSIADHTKGKSILVFSAAGPGQNGIDHVNCRLGSHWRTKLHDLGFGYRPDYTTRMQLAANLVLAPSRDLWIGNLQVFDK